MRQSLSPRKGLGTLLIAALALSITSCTRLSRHAVPAETANLSTTATEANSTAARININTASASELEALPGIGKVLAERIVAHREQYGTFRRIEHLIVVRGFSDHKFRAIRDLVTVK